MPKVIHGKNRWVLKHADEHKVKALQNALKIHPVLCKMLIQRGIDTFEKARTFFRPSLSDLHDPFLMKDMDRALSRIEQALDKQEKILIYGDYDVDGTTAVALVYSFFDEFYNHLGFYIPDRYAEGYGISIKGIDYAVENGYTLVIALDCGIRAVDKVLYANEKNLDFIICDHHLPGYEIPAAKAILDPQQSDCHYPYKDLSGCGIGFKLIQAFARHNHIPDEKVYKHLDLVAVSIASDIVPITGENRTLAFFGMKQLNDNARKGLELLMDVGEVKNKESSTPLNVMDVVFKIGPRINAAGRMADANAAVRLLLSPCDENALKVAKSLNINNDDRKTIDRSITKEALEMIAGSEDLIERKTTVLFNKKWHKGVIGIVASRLIETYYRPTVIFTESRGMLTGSARSVEGFDLYAALCECKQYIEQFGGHKYAAGLTLKPENFDKFSARFEEVVDQTIDDDLLVPKIYIDTQFDLSQVNYKFYNIMKQFAPYGPGNLKPLFMSKGVYDTGKSRIVGNNHLQLNIRHNGSRPFKGIAFGMGDLYDAIKADPDDLFPGLNKFDICYHIEENIWNNTRTLQLNIKDIKIAGD